MPREQYVYVDLGERPRWVVRYSENPNRPYYCVSYRDNRPPALWKCDTHSAKEILQKIVNFKYFWVVGNNCRPVRCVFQARKQVKFKIY